MRRIDPALLVMPRRVSAALHIGLPGPSDQVTMVLAARRNVESQLPTSPIESSVSFLNQLESQANALQPQQTHVRLNLEENTAHTEGACRLAMQHPHDLARHLSAIGPKAPRFSLDGKTPWPAMRLTELRVDSRPKMLRDREAFDLLAIGWRDGELNRFV